MRVNFKNQQKALSFHAREVKSIVREIIHFEGFACDEVSVYLVSKRKIAKLHAVYFNDPTPTDCISFPLDSSFLGEVFVCPEVAVEYAKRHGLDPYQETTLYIIHGLLHLMGYDDIHSKDRQAMRRAERRHLKHLHAISRSIKLCFPS